MLGDLGSWLDKLLDFDAPATVIVKRKKTDASKEIASSDTNSENKTVNSH